MCSHECVCAGVDTSTGDSTCTGVPLVFLVCDPCAFHTPVPVVGGGGSGDTQTDKDWARCFNKLRVHYTHGHRRVVLCRCHPRIYRRNNGARSHIAHTNKTLQIRIRANCLAALTSVDAQEGDCASRTLEVLFSNGWRISLLPLPTGHEQSRLGAKHFCYIFLRTGKRDEDIRTD